MASLHRKIIPAAAGVLALASLLYDIGVARAQNTARFPSRAVLVVVPFAPGGFPDTLSRIVGQKLSENLKQPFLIENRPGAGGIAAGEFVAKSTPDGHTLLAATYALWGVSPAIYKTLPFDPVKSFAPVARVGSVASFLAMRTDMPGTLKDSIAFLKADPGKYNYGTPGIGSIQHLITERLKSVTGIDVVHIPYRGGVQVGAALNSGEISLAFQTMETARIAVQTGKARLVGVATANRSSFAPEVPSFTELGYPEIEFTGAVGFVAPAGTPAAILGVLAAEFKKAAMDPDVQRRLRDAAIEPDVTGPEELTALIRSDMIKLKGAADAAGVKPE